MVAAQVDAAAVATITGFAAQACAQCVDVLVVVTAVGAGVGELRRRVASVTPTATDGLGEDRW